MSARVIAAFAFVLGTAAAAQARPQVVHRFTNVPDGALPLGAPIAHHALLYGVAFAGGSAGAGAIYSIDYSSKAESVIYSFPGPGTPIGYAPHGLVAVGDALYGTTSFGGAFNGGTIFRYDLTTNSMSVVYSFGSSANDAATPGGSLTLADGRLFGVTAAGGISGQGTVFAFDPGTGQERVLYSFAGGADAEEPSAPVTFVNGLLYGTTYLGGATGKGTIFAVNAITGQESVLLSFDGANNGASPYAGLVFQNGWLYGTAAAGGEHNYGTVFRYSVASGEMKVLHRFAGGIDGAAPVGELALAGRVLYGTTSRGGSTDSGTLFQINTDEHFDSVYQFHNIPDGGAPQDLRAIDNWIVGNAEVGGGAGGSGTIFAFRP